MEAGGERHQKMEGGKFWEGGGVGLTFERQVAGAGVGEGAIV